MACKPLITDPYDFPRRPYNRPGLPRIAYRIGRYADFVEAMTRGIDAAPELAAWTHRDADDPGIALLEGAAILGDILTFYQEHYANEAFLRTAAWRESVAELVRLTGYRLAPGVGGRATLAFEARGNAPVVIRQGFPVKADLADILTPADFETDAELTAWPHLGRFNLFRQRHYGPVVPGGQAQFELSSADGATDSIALEAVELKKGDRLLLVPEENTLVPLLLGGQPLDQPAEEIVIVDKVERSRGRVIITLAGRLTRAWPNPSRAYRLRRSIRHFGATAPLQLVETNTASTPPTTTSTSTRFHRDLRNATSHGSAYSVIDQRVFPLEQEIGDFAAGSTVIVTGIATGTAINAVPFPGFGFVFIYVLPFAVARRVVAVHSLGLRWGNLSSPVTSLQLHNILAPSTTVGSSALADIRTLRLHETKGPELTLRPISNPSNAVFTSGTDALYFYGTALQAQALAGRRLYLSNPDGRSVELVCTNAATALAQPTPDAPQMWPLSFDRAPTPFTRADFDETTPTVTVFGNLVDASQGKSEREAILGNGDHRQSFQTFPLPKAPLTYFLSAGAIPPQTPELEIWVNGRLWARVDAFFGHGPKEEIYIVREDAENRSFVQFGDGETGARLPSGVKNVKAIYRTGTGARGPIKPGATPTASERPPGFDKVALAGIVSGGADPEDQERAREAAPGKVQSLGRLVSIRDYETETLAIPGVVTATATWDLHAGVPAVILRILLEAGREAEFSEVRAAIAHAQRCRGPDRFALVIEQALLRYAFADVSYARDPTYQQAVVEAALRAALGLVGDDANERTGVFGLHARRLGEREYASRIEGRLQNVAGVRWCKLTGLGLFPAPAPGAPPITDPATLVLPPAPRPAGSTLPCPPHELLQLAGQHFTLTAIAEPVGE
jgi:hypothetical protein